MVQPPGIKESKGANRPSGDYEYRTHVGPVENYDTFSANQFSLLTALGLREDHKLLDIGCGSLRAGRLFIPYLLPDRYFAIEPEAWLVEQGFIHELGHDIVEIKRPTFDANEDFRLSVFGEQFDYMIAQSVFSHTSQAQMRNCFAEAKKVLAPNGVFAATFFEGDRNYEGNRWVVKAMYSLKRMTELVEEHDLACRLIDWPHPDLQSWLLIHQPGAKITFPNVSEAGRVQQLEEQLTLNRDKLAMLGTHPYMRFGYRVQSTLAWLGFKYRQIGRSFRS